MNSKRLFFILIALLVAVNSLGAAAVVLGNKHLEKQNTKLTELKVEADTLDKVQISLARAKRDLGNYASLEQILNTVVPQEKDQARTVREIVKFADESGVVLSTIAFPTSSLGNTTTGAAAAPGTTAASPTTASSNTQTQKVEGLSNVERLEITVTSDAGYTVPYGNLLQFLSKLEQSRRTAQVSNIVITPKTDLGGGVTFSFSLVLNVYLKK